ncbi:chaperone protein DnaJ 49 [Tanacetum coccineum]
MGFTKNGHEQVATSAEQIESGNRYPDSVEDRVIHVFGVCMVAFTLAVLFWLAYSDLTHDGAPYSFKKNVVFKNHMKTNEYGISYYVRSRGRFDKKYPVGTPARAEFEKYHVIKDYIEMEQKKCKEESGWKNHYVAQESFPACDKLRDMGLNPYPKF